MASFLFLFFMFTGLLMSVDNICFQSPWKATVTAIQYCCCSLWSINTSSMPAESKQHFSNLIYFHYIILIWICCRLTKIHLSQRVIWIRTYWRWDGVAASVFMILTEMSRVQLLVSVRISFPSLSYVTCRHPGSVSAQGLKPAFGLTSLLSV